MDSIIVSNVAIQLTDSLSFKWYRSKNVLVRGCGFVDGCILNEAELGNYIISSNLQTENELICLIDTIDGFYNIIISIDNVGIFCFSDQIRSMPLFFHPPEKDRSYLELYDSIDGNHPSRRIIDKEMVDVFRHSLFIPGNRTVFKNVFSINAGEYLKISDKRIEIKEYFEFDYHNTLDNKEKCVNKIIEEYDSCINNIIQFLNGRTAVIPLSGGHDSRFLLYCLIKCGYRKIITYSYGNRNNEESTISNKIALLLGVKWIFVEYNKKEMRKLFRKQYKSFSFAGVGGGVSSSAARMVCSLFLKKRKSDSK